MVKSDYCKECKKMCKDYDCYILNTKELEKI